MPTPCLIQRPKALVRELIAEGTTEQSYVRADHAGAYLIVTAPDLASAEAAMQTLPMATAGLLEFDYVELVPDGP